MGLKKLVLAVVLGVFLQSLAWGNPLSMKERSLLEEFRAKLTTVNVMPKKERLYSEAGFDELIRLVFLPQAEIRYDGMGGDIFLRLPWSSIYFVRDVDLERLDHFVELNRNAGASIQNIIADFELNFVKKLEVPYPYFRSRDGQTFDQVDGDHDGISWRFSYLKPLRDERERGVRRTAKFRSLSHESVPVSLHLSDDSENFLMVERYRYLPIRLGRNNPNFVLYYGYRHKMRLIRNARISKNEKYYESLNPPRNLLLTERGDWIQYDIDSNWGVRAIWNGKAFEKYLSENPEFEQKVFESLARTSPSKVELLEEARSRKTHTWKSIVFDQYCKTASDAVRNDFREVPLNSGL